MVVVVATWPGIGMYVDPAGYLAPVTEAVWIYRLHRPPGAANAGHYQAARFSFSLGAEWELRNGGPGAQVGARGNCKAPGLFVVGTAGGLELP